MFDGAIYRELGKAKNMWTRKSESSETCYTWSVCETSKQEFRKKCYKSGA